ncbi:hypothetical protein [Paraburkholderia jirisanensis]
MEAGGTDSAGALQCCNGLPASSDPPTPTACSKARMRAAHARPGARTDWIVLDPDHPDLAGQTGATWLSSVVFCGHGQTPVRDVETSNFLLARVNAMRYCKR